MAANSNKSGRRYFFEPGNFRGLWVIFGAFKKDFDQSHFA